MVQGKERQEGLVKRQRWLPQGWFSALTSPTKVQGEDFHQSKGRGKDQTREGKQGTYPPSGFSASETPNGEGSGQAWESDVWSASHWTDDSWTPHAGWFCTRTNTAWMMATPLNLANHPTHVVLDLGCTQSIGSRAAIERFQKHAWYYGITTKFCRGDISVVFANSETETCKEKLPYPFSNKVDVLLVFHFSDEKLGDY